MHSWLACTLGNPLAICNECNEQLTSMIVSNGILDTKYNRLYLVTVFNTSYGVRLRYHGQSRAWARKNGKAYHKKHGHKS